MADLQHTFEKEMVKQIQGKLGSKSTMAVPRIKKIVLNTSSKELLQDKKNFEKAKEELMLLSGQKPKITKARLSIASFKLIKGNEIGLIVTLRGKRMYDFFEKLVKIVLPRVRDFRGISATAFDGRGNLTIGFSEHTVFAEIDPGKVDKIRSLEVTIVTDAKDDTKAKVLLETLGMPFTKIKD